jgi:hypothetical protein
MYPLVTEEVAAELTVERLIAERPVIEGTITQMIVAEEPSADEQVK